MSDKPELGLFFGGSYYLGDLNQFGHFKNTKPAFGLVYRKNFNPRFAFKCNGFYGNVEAFDKESGNKYQRLRNLNFRSRIIEASGQVEFNFLPYTIGDSETPFSPYVFTGLSVFNFNPQALFNGQWINLRDYNTEGQGILPGKKNYAGTQVSFPFGCGFKITVNDKLGMALEWGLRKTFTDYLDDVSGTYISAEVLKMVHGTDGAKIANPNYNSNDKSTDMSGYQRGNPGRRDLYSFAGITLTYRFGNEKGCYFNSK